MSATTRMLATLFAATSPVAAGEAVAQPWPAKPIRIVAPDPSRISR